MAILAKKPYPGDWEWHPHEPSEAYLQRIQKLEQALYTAQPSADSESLVGAVVCFPVADGQAVYVVIKDRPLTLQHVPMFDAWHADPRLIRGTRPEDVRRELRFHEIFKSAKPS